MQHEQRNNQHLGVGRRWWQKEAAKVQAARPNAARGAPWAGPEVAFERVRAAAQGDARRLDEAYRVANFGRALGSTSRTGAKHVAHGSKVAQGREYAPYAKSDGGLGVQQFRTAPIAQQEIYPGNYLGFYGTR